MLEAIFKAVAISAISAVVMILVAQLIIWGLAIYHVSSGIWPVWLIGSGVESIIALGVTSGVRAGVKLLSKEI